MLISKNQYILFNSKRGNEKEGEKKERKIEKGMCGGAGRVTKVRNVTPWVPTTPCCFPPSGLLGGQGPLPKSIKSHGLV